MSDFDTRPIGVFDSGIGGITVLKELAHQFPKENFVYVGDTARLPYGSKSPGTIRKYSEQIIQFLKKQNVKAIVIACNTASSQVPEKELLETPIYNVIEPGSLRALQLSNSKKIGLVATRATVQSQAYTKRIHSLEPKAEVFAQAAPLFVPLAEEGWDSDPITNLIVFRYLKPLLDENIDTLILGCTHYPILKNSISRVTGSHIELIDSGEAIARWIEQDISDKRILPNLTSENRTIDIMTTDQSDHFNRLAEKLLSPLKPDSFSVVNV